MSTLKVQIGANISQLEKALQTAQGRLRSFGSSMSSIGRTLSTRVTAPLVALGGISLKTAADFETLQQSMNVLNGSVEEGARNFERLKQFSAGTPFQLNDLAAAQNMLQGFGLAADEAFESISMIGDIAAITGGDIQSIGIAFGQAAAEGKLFTRDIRQLINQGVPAVKLLADTMGVAQNEVFKLAEEGQISFEILQKAFREATTEGGMFANGMAQQANTLNGIWSTLKDNVSIALAELGESISETFNIRENAKELIENIQNVVKWFQSLSDEGRATMLKIVAAVGLVPSALIALGTAFTVVGIAIAGLTSPIFLVTAALTAIVGAFEYVRRNIDAFVDHFKFGFTNLKNDVIQNVADMQEAIAKWAIFLPGVTESAILQARASILSLKDPIPTIETEFQSMGEFVKSIFSDIVGFSEQMTGLDFASMFDTKEIEEAESSVQSLTSSVSKFTTSISKANLTSLFGAGLTDSITQVTNKVEGFGFATTNVVEQLKIKLPELRNAVTGNIDPMSKAFDRIRERMRMWSEGVHMAMQSATVSFFEGLGAMASGGASLADVIVGALADFASRIGKIIVGIGFAMLQLQPQNLFTNPIGAIVAGGALIALGAALRSAVSAGPGGSGSSSVDEFERSATSVPTDRDRGGTVEFRIGNDALVGVLQQGSKRNKRIGKQVNLQS